MAAYDFTLGHFARVATISVCVLKIVFRFFSELHVIHILRFKVATLLILRIQVFLVVRYCLHLQRLRNRNIPHHFKMKVKC